MEAMRITLSHHLTADRLERMTAIATTIGFGKIVEEFEDDIYGEPTWHCLTDTGVLLVKSADKTKVITLYVATAHRISAYYYKKRNHQPAPAYLMRIAKNNERKRPYLFI